MKIFTIANLKGGCSKTTSFMHAGGEIAKLGNRILGIDADPQMSAYK
jgi:cellulose biosynthesis protein BcsQ